MPEHKQGGQQTTSYDNNVQEEDRNYQKNNKKKIEMKTQRKIPQKIGKNRIK